MSAANVQASATAKYGLVSPLLSPTFTMTIPAGVSVQAYSSVPNLATTPSFENTTRLLTWNLGETVRPGKSVKISLKMLPTACSTLAALALNGQFSFTVYLARRR